MPLLWTLGTYRSISGSRGIFESRYDIESLQPHLSTLTAD